MIPASVRSIPVRAVLPAGIIFVFFSLISLGLLTMGPDAFGKATVAGFLFPLFALIFIGVLSLACAIFTLYQEPFFVRFPGLRRMAVLSSLTLEAGLVLILRHTHIHQDLFCILASANLVIMALLLGNFLVSGLNRPSELIPVCIVMSVADLISVLTGPSKQMIKGIEAYYRHGRLGAVPWSDFLLVKIAVPGVDHMLPVFGVTDVVVLAFLIAAAHKFRLNDNLLGRGLGDMKGGACLVRWFPVAGGGLAFALLAAHGFNLFLPALPVIALFFLGYTLPRHPEMLLLRKTEGAVVLLSLAVLSGWAIWL